MDIFFCDVCAARVTSVHLRRGQGARSNDVVICAGCIEKGQGLDLLDAEPALVGSEKEPVLAGAQALNDARDRAKTALADQVVESPASAAEQITEEPPKEEPKELSAADDIDGDLLVTQPVGPSAKEHHSDDLTLEDDSSALEPSSDEAVDLATTEDDSGNQFIDDDVEEDLIEDGQSGPELLDDAEEVDPETLAQADATGRIEAPPQDVLDVEAAEEVQSDQTDMYSPEQVAEMRREAGVEEDAAENSSSSALEAVAASPSRSGRTKSRKSGPRGAGKSAGGKKGTASSKKPAASSKSGRNNASKSGRSKSTGKSNRSSSRSKASSSAGANKNVIIISAVSLTLLIVLGFMFMGGGSSRAGGGDPYAGMNALQSISDRQTDVISSVRSALASENPQKLEKARDKVFAFISFVETDFKNFVMNERNYSQEQYVRDSQHYLTPVTRYRREINEKIVMLKQQGK